VFDLIKDTFLNIFPFLEDMTIKRMEEAASEYPDIKILWDDFNKLKNQKSGDSPMWSDKFLEGYWSCISDLIYIKKHFK
jgi:hypothetical protein